jgi:hypothetical protein
MDTRIEGSLVVHQTTGADDISTHRRAIWAAIEPNAPAILHDYFGDLRQVGAIAVTC